MPPERFREQVSPYLSDLVCRIFHLSPGGRLAGFVGPFPQPLLIKSPRIQLLKHSIQVLLCLAKGSMTHSVTLPVRRPAEAACTDTKIPTLRIRGLNGIECRSVSWDEYGEGGRPMACFTRLTRRKRCISTGSDTEKLKQARLPMRRVS